MRCGIYHWSGREVESGVMEREEVKEEVSGGR